MDAQLRDRLAYDRTVLALERTALAYARTALAFLAAGVTALHVVPGLAWAGWGLVVAALAIVGFGAWRLSHLRQDIKSARQG